MLQRHLFPRKKQNHHFFHQLKKRIPPFPGPRASRLIAHQRVNEVLSGLVRVLASISKSELRVVEGEIHRARPSHC